MFLQKSEITILSVTVIFNSDYLLSTAESRFHLVRDSSSSCKVPLLHAWLVTSRSSNQDVFKTWSYFAITNVLYLHRCCSKDTEIARHFPGRRRTQYTRVRSPICGPIAHVLRPEPWAGLEARSWLCSAWLQNQLVPLGCRIRRDTSLDRCLYSPW